MMTAFSLSVNRQLTAYSRKKAARKCIPGLCFSWSGHGTTLPHDPLLAGLNGELAFKDRGHFDTKLLKVYLGIVFDFIPAGQIEPNTPIFIKPPKLTPDGLQAFL